MAKGSSFFECQSCGYSSPKWMGRCPDCGGWNSFAEERRARRPDGSSRPGIDSVQVLRLSEISTESAPRVVTANNEFNRVLGGGIVPGSLVLLGGEPGIGKSTLLLQIALSLAETGRRVLYVSGEESARQIKMRADRLSEGGQREVPAAEMPVGPGQCGAPQEIFILAEAAFEKIETVFKDIGPTDLIIDSIQTAFSETLDSAPGSISQVRHVASQLLTMAKSEHVPVFLIGHVTKDGSLAGPKALEHIVDAVLYFEGERHHNHRIVRAVKNRFGAANEVGIFEMTSRGLIPVRNPSDLFLREREIASPGSAVVCAMEGTRPILVEVQSLVNATQYGTGRRMSAGIDQNRISMLVAILEKRLSIPLTGCDVYVNTSGGLEIEEPGSDLAIFCAILSSLRNRPLSAGTVFLGELSLSGEIRPIGQVHARVREAASMGFQKCILPAGNLPLVSPAGSIQLVPVKTVNDLADVAFSD
jgi:DNA repair protein RadA/Sms